MIIDPSAVVALALNEAEAGMIYEALSRSGPRRMSAGSWIELQAVSTRRFAGTLDERLIELHKRFAIEIVALTTELAELGRHAYRTFGLGTQHPARLNIGDCFSYALAKATCEPLLFKGDGFIHTDVLTVL